jgi:Uma2 family endonuclease
MVMPDTARHYTVDEVLAFPEDGNRYELVDGELLVTPAPGTVHQMVVSRLFAELSSYLKGQSELTVLPAPADITWGGERLVQPDLFVIPARDLSRSWKTVQTLLLAIEVLSPSSARADRIVKRRLYQRQGVETYWIVDPDAALVEVWHPSDERPEIVTEVLRWHGESRADAFEMNLSSLFGDLPR